MLFFGILSILLLTVSAETVGDTCSAVVKNACDKTSRSSGIYFITSTLFHFAKLEQFLYYFIIFDTYKLFFINFLIY